MFALNTGWSGLMMVAGWGAASISAILVAIGVVVGSLRGDEIAEAMSAKPAEPAVRFVESNHQLAA